MTTGNVSNVILVYNVGAQCCNFSLKLLVMFGLLSRQPVDQRVLQARSSPQSSHLVGLSSKGCVSHRNTENITIKIEKIVTCKVVELQEADVCGRD